jgi:hypothetical protein
MNAAWHGTLGQFGAQLGRGGNGRKQSGTRAVTQRGHSSAGYAYTRSQLFFNGVLSNSSSPQLAKQHDK